MSLFAVSVYQRGFHASRNVAQGQDSLYLTGHRGGGSSGMWPSTYGSADIFIFLSHYTVMVMLCLAVQYAQS
jgi:hypothetical protein